MSDPAVNAPNPVSPSERDKLIRSTFIEFHRDLSELDELCEHDDILNRVACRARVLSDRLGTRDFESRR